jgi:carbon-monoxide dehydrogenase medium subunit
VDATGPRGQRSIPIDSFFIGPGKTSLEQGELVTGVIVPDQRDAATSFARVSRTDMDLAKVNVAVVVRIEKQTFRAVRIALGAVAPTPVRARRAEEFLLGRRASERAVREAAELASGEAKPITDARSTAEYRRDVTEVLVRRTLLSALEAHGGHLA